MKDIPRKVKFELNRSKYDYQLVVWLEGKADSDIEEDSKQAFSKALSYWKKNTLPSLARSDYVIFIRGKNKVVEIDL